MRQFFAKAESGGGEVVVAKQGGPPGRGQGIVAELGDEPIEGDAEVGARPPELGTGEAIAQPDPGAGWLAGWLGHGFWPLWL